MKQSQSKSKIKGIIEQKNKTISYATPRFHPDDQKTEKERMEETRNAIRRQRKLAEERRERERKELRRLGRGI
jgi:hypothetical protein